MGKRFSHPGWFLGFLVVMSLGLIAGGIETLVEGNVLYSNYWGGQVFAPFAIGFGVLLLILLPFLWRQRNERPPVLKGKAARLERQAKETRFPIEDFDKPWNP